MFFSDGEEKLSAEDIERTGELYMKKGKFHTAIFEVVQMWADGDTKEDYAIELKKICSTKFSLNIGIVYDS